MKLPDWRARFWWFDVVYPITLAALLFWSLTSIVFSGGPSSRLSLMAENKLVEFSQLIGAGENARDTKDILVVTADALETERLGRAPFGTEPDAALPSYSELLDRLIDGGVKVIFLRWNIKSHLNDETYYLPMIHSLKKAKDLGVKVFVSIDVADSTGLPKAFLHSASTLDDVSCREENMIQTYCTYNADWREWIFVTMVDELKPFSSDARNVQTFLSTQLPTNSPGIILNLPELKSLRRCSFESVLGGSCGAIAGTSIAFVGTNVSGAIRPSDQPVHPERVRTAYDDLKVDVAASGTSKHEFWAMAAQMFVDDRAVRTPTEKMSLGIAAITSLIVIFLTFRFGGPIAVGIFAACAIASPFFNALSIRELNFYVPLFNIYYFGISTFIIVGFSRLSFTAFKRWRLLETQRMHSLTADLKSNFISLLSHNLNTPVAKMQGLLSMLKTQANLQTEKEAVLQIERSVAKLEYAIRSVLVASTLEEGAPTESSKSLKFLLEDFKQSMLPSLRRLGVQVQFGDNETLSQNLEAMMVPIRIDARAFQTALAAALGLFASEDEISKVTLTVEPNETDHGVDLRLVIAGQESRIAEAAARVLNYPEIPPIRSLGNQSFTAEIMAGLIRLLAETYRGQVALVRDAESTTIVIDLSLYGAALQSGTTIAQ